MNENIAPAHLPRPAPARAGALDQLPPHLDAAAAKSLLGWHAALTLGPGEVGRFRGWDRLLRLRQKPRATTRARILTGYAITPLKAIRETWRSVRAHGGEVAQRYGVSRPRQFVEQWWLRSRHGILPESYYLFRLHLPDRRGRAAQYLQVSELDRVSRLLVARTGPAAADILKDKRRFGAWCHRNGFPAIETLAEFDRYGSTTMSDPGALPHADLFSKATDMRSGKGTRVWRYAGDGTWIDDAGSRHDARAVIAAVAADAVALRRAVVLQRRLVNHPDLMHLTNGALSTIRVVTLREPDGEPYVALAAYRMGVGESIADNLSQGGMGAPVDVATGRLGVAVRMNAPLFEECDEHPATGGRISGTRIPFWRDVMDLTLRGHRELPGLAFVGWDVAVTGDGPVLVEGNRYPSARLSQVTSGVPLGETPFVGCFNRHMLASFGLQ